MMPRDGLLRLTVDHQTGNVTINQRDVPTRTAKQSIFGRSAYLCFDELCFVKAQKGARLHKALAGRKKLKSAKDGQCSVIVRWPLEPQLIKVIIELCTEHGKTCQNTER
ncbi:MAG: DUF448 domain-containing protein [Candidatus Obscuribacterales bacterium]|nr:DUF448 domain-containing protein [Candidatus Obscuribacterales bacterium]